MSDSGNTLFGLNRNLLTGIGIVLIIAGIIMFLAAASIFGAPSPDPFDFAATQARMSSTFTTAAIGMVLLFVGLGALRFWAGETRHELLGVRSVSSY